MDGNPPISRHDAKRAAIVAVAKSLFFEEGYVAASMAEIAARVGGSKATLYNHFRSKEELLIAVIEDVLAPVEGEVTAGPPPSGDFRTWLVWFGRVSIAKITSYELVSLQRLAAAEALRFPEVGRIFYEKGIVPSLEMVAPFFARAMEDGAIRRGDPRLAAELFLELCTGWMLRRIVWNISPPPTEPEIESQVHTAITVFMNGYALR